MMSSFNTTTNSIQAEEISDQIQMITYCEIGLSIVTFFANLANFFVIRKKFSKILVYQIQQIDSLVTAVSQIGFIVILLNSISSTPNASQCTLGSTLAVISGVHFVLSNLLMAAGKHIKVKAALDGGPIPSEKYILKFCSICSSCIILYAFIVTLIDFTCTAVQIKPFIPVTLVPEYPVCMRSNYKEALLEWHIGKLFISIPFTIIIATNILIDVNDIRKVTSSHLSIMNETPLRTSCITGLFIVNLMLSSLFDEGLFAIGLILVFLLIKGPLIVIWTNHRLKQKSLKKHQQVERSFSEQAQFSQLESHAVNEL